MSNTYLNTLPVETLSLNTFPLAFLILVLVEFILLHVWKRIDNFLSEGNSSIQSQLTESNDLKVEAAGLKNEEIDDLSNKQSLLREKAFDESVCRGEMELVLRSLGISCSPDEGQLPMRLDSNDIFELFEEKNPGLDEVKEAFDVFDGNKDGFIDPRELQMVLGTLGFVEGSEMENCRRMIRAFDENGDGRIDFQEFVKFMQSSLC
ncbi:probable calcium-binding CML45 [Olea europaea subsp. europaea]|uniref:Probable calcium-binding CML45 n=1 Tax=Olea europaea subsp. europaea TaxID=158383 RepID=A0A8S0UHN3_OLEEU|nr:probable calcium-binding CML45 [Olea europaea subsp. europaea]